jgi:hypothetical protein
MAAVGATESQHPGAPARFDRPGDRADEVEFVGDEDAQQLLAKQMARWAGLLDRLK